MLEYYGVFLLNEITSVPSIETDIPDAGEYIGNKNSKKFHLPTCKNLPAEKNRVYLESRNEALQKGYDPCGNCNP